MTGAWSMIWRSTAAQAAPAFAGSVVCRLRACLILRSTSRLQNSEAFVLLPLLGTNASHRRAEVALAGDGNHGAKNAPICALCRESTR